MGVRRGWGEGLSVHFGMIDTAQVRIGEGGRRELRFATLEERAAKARIMSAPMRPGERIVEGPAGTLATEAVGDAEGLARLEAGAPDRRLPLEDPELGVLTHHEWTQMSLRHAEPHLSFFVAR